MYLEIFPFECDSHCQMLCASKKPLSVQSLSFAQLCDPMDCSTPAFPVHHQLLKLAQTHVHRVGDATQPSHPLSSPSTDLDKGEENSSVSRRLEKSTGEM